MAAEQTPGTPPPAVEETAAPSTVGEVRTEGAAADEDTPAEPLKVGSREWLKKMAEGKKKAREAKAAGKPEPTEGDEPAPEAKPEPKKLDDISAELFTAEALSTPEGVKRAGEIVQFAKDELERRHKKLDSFDMGLKAKKKKNDEREATITQREQRFQHVAGQFVQSMQIITGARQAAPLAICEHLDKLAGGKGDAKAGRDLLESMILAMGRDGEAPKETPRERQWRERIERMEQERQAERQQAEQAQRAQELAYYEQQNSHLELNIGTAAASNPGQYPSIARYIAAGRTDAAAIGKYCGDLMHDYAKNGQPIDMATAIGILEENLTLPGVGGAAQAENGSGRQQSAESQPRAKSAAKKPTVLPSDADRSLGGTRKESPEERRARLARDPTFLKRLGPVIENAARG